MEKISLTLPDAIIDLHQQLKPDDSLSFQAETNWGTGVTISMTRQKDFLTEIQIQTNNETSVLGFSENEWRCNIKEIISEVFLVKAAQSEPIVSQKELTEEETQSNILNLLQQPGLQFVKLEDSSEVLEINAPVKNDTALQSSVTDPQSQETEEQSNEAKSDPQVQDVNHSVNLGVTKNRASNQTVVTIGKQGKVTVSAGGVDKVYREETPAVCDQAEQVELGDDTIIAWQERQRRNEETRMDDISALEEVDSHCDDEETGKKAQVYVMTSEKLDKMIVSKDLKKNQDTDPEAIITNFPILKEGDKFKCFKCGLLFLKKAYLISHMRFVHKLCIRQPLSVMKCPYCSQQFVRKNRFDEHMIHKHSNSKPYLCDIPGCPQAFKSQYNLRDHKRVSHYRMLRYECSNCHKQYENPNLMVKHYTNCVNAGESTGAVLEKTAEELRNPNWIPVDELFKKPVPDHMGQHGRYAQAHETESGAQMENEDASAAFTIEDNLDGQPEPKRIKIIESPRVAQQDTHLMVIDSHVTTHAVISEPVDNSRKSVRLASKEKPNYLRLVKTDSSSDQQSKDEGQKRLKPPLFSVQSLLSAIGQKFYHVDREELSRRLYGPETLNAPLISLMVTHTTTFGVVRNLRMQLLAAALELPKCPPIVSSFTRLCEGEVADLLSDHSNLLATYLPPSLLIPVVVTEISDSHSLTLTKSYLDMVLGQLPHFCEDLDQVTHNFGSGIIAQILNNALLLLQSAENSLGPGIVVDSFTETEPETASGSNARVSFEVPALLSAEDDNLKYMVATEEIHRRLSKPEEMSVTLLHEYLRRPKHDYALLTKECLEMGLEIQTDNKTAVVSAFSRIIEAEGRQLCEDFEQFLYDYVDVSALQSASFKAFMQETGVEIDKSESIISQIRTVQLIIRQAVSQRGRNYDLVTHAMGQRLFSIASDFVNNLLTISLTN